MRLYVKNTEVPYNSISLRESFSSYYGTILVNTDFPLSGVLTFEYGGRREEFYTMETFREGNQYNTSLISVKIHRILNSTFGEFLGKCDTEALLRTLGIKVRSRIKTSQVAWTLPKGKFQTLINLLRDRISVPNGAGALITLDLWGDAVITDLKSAAEKEAEPIVGQMKSLKVSYDWKTSVTGEVEEFVYDGTGVKSSSLNFLEGFGKSIVRSFNTLEEFKDVNARIVRNQFYRKLYTSKVLSLTNVIAEKISLGSTVADTYTNEKYVVYSLVLGRVLDTVTIETVLVNKS